MIVVKADAAAAPVGSSSAAVEAAAPLLPAPLLRRRWEGAAGVLQPVYLPTGSGRSSRAE